MNDKLIKIKFPLTFFYLLVKNKSLFNDKQFIKIFIKMITLHQDYYIKFNIVQLFIPIKNTHPNSWKMIKLYQKIIDTNIINFNNIKKYSLKTNKRLFFLPLHKQLSYWQDKLTIINYLDDNSYGNSFSILLSEIQQPHPDILIQIIDRLYKLKTTLGTSFFKKEQILLFTIEDFYSLPWQEQKIIFFKFFSSIRKKINYKIKLIDDTIDYLNTINSIYKLCFIEES